MAMKIRRLAGSLLARVLSAYLILGLAWLASTPPGGGVDEASHYVRAVGISRGQLIGDEVDPDQPFLNLRGERLRRINAESGIFFLPLKAPPPPTCNALDAVRPFDCLIPKTESGTLAAISLHGRSLPGAYVVPALFSRLGVDTTSTTMLLRLGMLLQNAVMLGIVIRALQVIFHDRHLPSMSLVTVMTLSVTPVLLFLSSTMSPSSFETMAAAAFAASLIAAVRTRSMTWLVGSVALAWIASWARDLGAVAVVVSMASILLAEPSSRRWWQESDRKKWLVVGGMTLGVATGLLWQVVFKYPLQPSIGSVAQLRQDVANVLRTLRSGIGLGGWLNVPLDPVLESMWFVFLIGAGAIMVSRVSRLVQGILAVQFVVVCGVGVYLVAMLRAAGFGIQARFFMPLLAVMLITLVSAASVTETHSERRIGPWPWRGLLAFVALSHAAALEISARRNAQGLDGRRIDFSHAVWSPPGGWMLSGMIALVGCVLVLTLPAPGAPKEHMARV